MNRALALFGFAFAASLAGAPLAAGSATCDGDQLVLHYDYCVFDASTGGDGGSAESSATLAQGTVSLVQPGSWTLVHVDVIDDYERTSGGETTQRDHSGAGATGKVLYRTEYNLSVGGGQERTDGASLADQRSSLGANALIYDPLLQRLGARTSYEQRAADGACVQTVRLDVYLISDVIGIAPTGACAAALPWADAGRVSATAASALP